MTPKGWAGRGRSWVRIAGVGLLLILVLPAGARGDDSGDSSCDSLTSVSPGEGTVWSWFEHPCPPAPEEASPALLPGVGVTLQGFWVPPTLYNPTGTPVSSSLALLNRQVQNGFGGGLEVTGWVASNLALRFQANLWTFPPQSGQYAFTMMPLLLGVEAKLLGGNRVYLYLAGDGGIALDGAKMANIFDGSSSSLYAQASVGINFYALQVEAGYGVLMTPQVSAGRTNPFFLVPLSLGIHL